MPDPRDVEITDDGDLVVDENGDLKLATGLRTLKQEVLMRVRTNYRDLKAHPTFGANLQQLFGKPCNNASADLAKQRISIAMAIGKRFARHGYEIYTMPIGIETIGAIVKLRPRLEDQVADQTILSFGLNFNEGTIDPVTI